MYRAVKMYWFALLMYVHLSAGTTLERSDTKCQELNKPGWKIDSLKNTNLDAWPWDCLQSRYTNESLKEQVFNLSADIYAAASKGYIGFVQYYAQKADFASAVDVASLLRVAAASGDLHAFKYLVEKKGLPVDAKDWNLLLAAASGGNVDLIKYLINEKKLVTASTVSDANTPSHAAAAKGRFEALRFFAETLNLPLDSKNSDGDTPALLAALAGNVPELKYLIDRGANVHVKNGKQRTLLHNAAFYGSVEATKYLVEVKHLSLDTRDKYGFTPAFLAAAGNYVPELKYLVEKGANLNVRTGVNDNYTILHEAVKRGALEATKYLVEEKNMSPELKDAYDRTAVHVAARNGKLELVKYLAGERHANLHTLDYFGLTSLHSAVVGKNVDVMRYLVDDMQMSSHIEDTEVVGLTPALEAARYGSVPILKYLLDEKHAEVGAVDFLGRNLLHTAAENLEFLTMKYLIEEKGFSVETRTGAGKTVQDIVYKNKFRVKIKDEILEYLKQKGQR